MRIITKYRASDLQRMAQELDEKPDYTTELRPLEFGKLYRTRDGKGVAELFQVDEATEQAWVHIWYKPHYHASHPWDISGRINHWTDSSAWSSLVPFHSVEDLSNMLEEIILR